MALDRTREICENYVLNNKTKNIKLLPALPNIVKMKKVSHAQKAHRKQLHLDSQLSTLRFFLLHDIKCYL